jgi:hypothetical protein
MRARETAQINHETERERRARIFDNGGIVIFILLFL